MVSGIAQPRLGVDGDKKLRWGSRKTECHKVETVSVCATKGEGKAHIATMTKITAKMCGVVKLKSECHKVETVSACIKS